MGKFEVSENNNSHEDIVKEIIYAERNIEGSKEKEKHVVKLATEKILKSENIGKLKKAWYKPVLKLTLRIALRAVIFMLNQAAGKGWVELFKTEETGK